MDFRYQRARGCARASCRCFCARAAHRCVVPGVGRELRDAEGISLAVPHLLDHCVLQERGFTRTRSLPQAAGWWPRKLDVESWDTHHAWALGDRRLVRVRRDAAYVLRDTVESA